jgi:putative transposase
MRPCIEQSSGLVSLSPFRSWPGCIINTFRYDFRKGQGQGESLPNVCRALAVSEQTFYRWRKELGNLKLSQAQRLRGLERENELLRRLVADLALANQQLKDQAGKDA